MRTFRTLFIILIGSVATLIVMAVAISGSLAQDATATPNPGIPTLLPACDAYHVTAASANIRACAAAGCRIVTQLSLNSMLCVLGPADTSQWLQVDLAPEDPSSPIVYVSADVVARGAPNTENTGCQSYLVDQDSKPVYSCAETTCNVLGTMQFEEWLCIVDYSGQYPGWSYASMSDSGLVGWVQNTGLRRGRQGSTNTAPTRTPGPPTFTSEPQTPVPSKTVGPATITPAGPITLAGAEPACQQYYVSADTADIRMCAGTSCEVAQTLARDATLCVRGITDNPEWLIVDLEPDTASTLYAIQRAQVKPGFPSVACVPFEITAPVDANVRSCPSLTCQIMGTVNNGDWVCARGFGGAYQDWVQIDIPGGHTGVWITASAVRELAGTGTPTAAFTPTGPMVCQPYTVNVARANVRTCPSTDCGIAGRVEQNNELCVYGPAVGAETTWFMVDLTPNDPNDAVSFISQNLVSPVAVVAGIGTPTVTLTATETPSVPTVTPTPTPFVTLLPTAIATTTAVTAPSTPILSKEVVLSTLRVRNFELNSPRGSNSFRFQLPTDWYMDGNSVLYLNIEYVETLSEAQRTASEVDLTSRLSVKLDSELVSSIALDNTIVGQQTLAIPLTNATISRTDRRNHSIEVTLDAEEHCLLDSDAKVFVRTDMSFFHFEFRETPPVLDLASYPRPFYNQRFSDDPESVLMVLPLEPEDVDMQAAARLSAGLGFLTGQNLRINVVSAEDITDQERQTNHLLLVGQLGTNPLIDQMYADNLFNTRLDSAGNMTMSDVPIDPDDGVVDMAINPDNPMRAVVAVTGKNPEALLKAAQALAGPPSLIGLGGPLAVVSSTRPVVRPQVGTTIEPDITFTDLGYPEITMTGIGVVSTEVEFYVPLGQTLTSEAYVDLVFSNSELIENGLTSLGLTLNNQTPLASQILGNFGDSSNGDTAATEIAPSSDANPLTPKHMRAWIPPSSIVPGERNTLTIIATIDGDWECITPDPSMTWVNISGDSKLHLPREISSQTLANPYVGWFPIPFNAQPDLSDVWIVAPDEPTRSDLEQAFDFASMLGSSVANGEGMAPHIHIGEIPDGTDLSAYHFIVLGRPTNNSFLASLNPNLPQPFLEGTDQLEQKLDDVSFRLPPGYEVGVLEMLPSPWSPERVILVVTGTGVNSQITAADALLEAMYGRTQLLGNVIFVSNAAAVAIDTRQLEEQVEMLTQVPELATETALLGSPTPIHNFTMTPGPTLTPLPTRTLGPTPTPSPIFTATPVLPTPTPMATLVPVTLGETQPADSELPGWFPILLAITGGVVVLAVVFGVAQSFRRGRGGMI